VKYVEFLVRICFAPKVKERKKGRRSQELVSRVDKSNAKLRQRGKKEGRKERTSKLTSKEKLDCKIRPAILLQRIFFCCESVSLI
jgi:hypothetical protein